MSLDVTIAGTALPLEPTSLKDLRTERKLVFDLAKDLKPYLEGAMELAPATGATAVTFTSDAASWNPAGSAVTFGLQGGAACSLEILNGGSLGTYTDGLDAPTLQQVPVPSGHAYVRLMMSFNLSANVSGAYSGGAYGVTAELTTKDSYCVTFCKAFLPSTKVSAAIAQTFQSFVLPFRERLLLDMDEGDHLWYEFDGNLGLAVGAYAGLDKVLYAGNGTADLLQLNGSPLATLGASIKPEVKLAAAMDFKMDYASRFEALLSKTGTTGRLHLCRSEKLSDTVTASAGLTINVNAGVTLTQKVSDHLADVKSSLVKCAGGAGTIGGDAVGKVAGLADGELNKYAGESTDKLQCWLNKADGKKCNLQVAIEQTRSKMLLASYAFDLADASFAAAWNYAIKGDLYGALNTSAVTLDTGSGLEREYRSKTSFTCNFFNLAHLNSWQEFTSSVGMVYAGNNVFHMLAKVGRTTGTDTVGASRGMDIYFSASADAKAGKPLENLDVSLNIALNGAGDKKVVETVARLLSAFDSTPAMANVVRDLRAFNGNKGARIVQLLVTIPAALFEKIHADPAAGPGDQKNWDAFVAAADALDAWALRSPAGLDPAMTAFLKHYSSWERMNTTQTGSSVPDRNHLVEVVTFPDDWTSLSSTSPAPRALIAHSLWAAQRYMNFCAALQELGASTAPAAVTPAWERLLAMMTRAVQQDLSIDFLRPAALATMQICKQSSYAITAPVGPAIPADHFCIAIAL